MAEAEGAFISVTKKTEANWNDLKDEIVAGIKACLLYTSPSPRD